MVPGSVIQFCDQFQALGRVVGIYWGASRPGSWDSRARVCSDSLWTQEATVALNTCGGGVRVRVCAPNQHGFSFLPKAPSLTGEVTSQGIVCPQGHRH